MRAAATYQFSDTGGAIAVSQRDDDLNVALDTGAQVIPFPIGGRSQLKPSATDRATLSWSRPTAQRNTFKEVCEDIVALAARRDGTWAAAKEDLRCRADQAGYRPATLKLLGFLLKHLNVEEGCDWRSAEVIADALGLSIKAIEYGFNELGRKHGRWILREVRDDIPTKGTQATKPWRTTIPMLLVVAKEVAARKEEAARKAGKDPYRNRGPRGEGPLQMGKKDPFKRRGKLEEGQLEEERGAGALPADAGFPPSPSNASLNAGAAPDGDAVRRATGGKGGRATDPCSDPDVVAARAAYNADAKRYGWIESTTLTPKLASGLRKQLAVIGGIEGFKLALAIIPRDRYLMGKVTPTNSRSPFRLSLHYLVERDDELAKLVDVARAAGPAANGTAPAAIDPDAVRRAVEANPYVAQHLSDAELREGFRNIAEAERPPMVRQRLAALRDGGRA